MPKFHYHARRPDGSELSELIEADDLAAAITTLQANQLEIVSIEVTESQETRQGEPSRHPSALAAALSAYAEELPAGRVQNELRMAVEQLREGGRLEELGGPHASRMIDTALLRHSTDALHELPALIRTVHRKAVRQRELWNTLGYPVLLAGTCLLLVTGLCLFVIPPFREVILDFQMGLPIFTRVVLYGTSWWLAFSSVVLVGALLLLWGPPGIRNALLARMPLIGSYRRNAMLADFCRRVSTGVRAGLSRMEALNLAATEAQSGALRSAANAWASCLSAHPPEPLVVTSPLQATIAYALEAEAATQARQSILEALAELYDQQAAESLRMIRTIFEPLLILAIALVVGVTVIGLMLPLVSLIQNLS